MIKTHYGETKVEANSRGEIMADFACIVKTLEAFFIEDEGKTEEQAKAEVRRLVEQALEFEEDENADESDEVLGKLLDLLRGKLLDLLRGKKADE